ncbi:hypothetical protein P43SY_009431 [Pythium insidiosum]|uniref:HIG1 domain-containing protein n=1 Tax=Pythium insidiosum TaxID=114742 RepID=A0AAD5Q7W3_PYTIN|nr:hypothetical protein P43SY_009431 [Pythium insidiosum]KAJ0408452.1 hypothetical protein ATCC90586_008390 [Pythium insidiosum]
MDLQGLPPLETGWDKMKRRCQEEPLVPLGCFLTAGVLAGGLRSFAKAADQRTQQRFMRARVVAQGATVLAAALGSVLAMKKKD